jgi:hypothetical protein
MAIWLVCIVAAALSKTFADPFLRPIRHSLMSALSASVNAKDAALYVTAGDTFAFVAPMLILGALIIWRFRLYR